MTVWPIVCGILSGVVIGALVVLVLQKEPMVTIRNGVLEGWTVTDDNEMLICEDPTVFIAAKQIECD